MVTADSAGGKTEGVTEEAWRETERRGIHTNRPAAEEPLSHFPLTPKEQK